MTKSCTETLKNVFSNAKKWPHYRRLKSTDSKEWALEANLSLYQLKDSSLLFLRKSSRITVTITITIIIIIIIIIITIIIIIMIIIIIIITTATTKRLVQINY